MNFWPDNSTVTDARARRFARRGAGDRARQYAGWQVGAVARRDPWFMLRYAADRLSPATLDWCARAEPWPALHYAADRLTSETLAYCKEQMK